MSFDTKFNFYFHKIFNNCKSPNIDGISIIQPNIFIIKSISWFPDFFQIKNIPKIDRKTRKNAHARNNTAGLEPASSSSKSAGDANMDKYMIKPSNLQKLQESLKNNNIDSHELDPQIPVTEGQILGINVKISFS